MSKQAVIYARVSTDEQAEKGYSLPSQIEACRKYARENDYEVVAEFTDDYSGREIDRPGLNDLRQMLGTSRVEVLIVYSGDRLSRYLAHSIELRRELSLLEVELCKVLGGQVDDSPQGRFTENVYGAVSQLESEMIVERTQRGKNQRAKSGYMILQGYPPFGYKKIGRGHDAEYQIEPGEARTVQDIFEWYTSGNGSYSPMSLREIAHHLNKFNIPGPHNCAKSVDYWNPFTVRKILTNEIYAGRTYWGKTRMVNKKRVYLPQDRWIPIDVPELAIVNRSSFEAAQERAERNKQLARRNRKNEYLMVGYLRCGACGNTIVGHARNYKSGQKVLYYRCGGQWKQFSGAEKCGLKSLDTVAHKIDNAVWGWIEKLLGDRQVLEVGLQEILNSREDYLAPNKKRLDSLDSLAGDEEKKIKRLISELGYHSDEVIITALRSEIEQSTKAFKALKEERNRLAQEMAQVELSQDQIDQVFVFAEIISQKLANASFEEKRMLMDLLEVQGILHYDELGKWLELTCAIPAFSDAISIELLPSTMKPQDQGRGYRS